jgi:hypothetical protein
MRTRTNMNVTATTETGTSPGGPATGWICRTAKLAVVVGMMFGALVAAGVAKSDRMLDSPGKLTKGEDAEPGGTSCIVSHFTPQQFHVSTAPLHLSVGDFNGDGIPDVVITMGQALEVRLGMTGGALSEPVMTMQASGRRPAVADLTNDGNLDLIVPTGSSTIEILLGNGDGTFSSVKPIKTSIVVGRLHAHDINQNGVVDLVVIGYDEGRILSGMGDGTFAEQSSFAISGSAAWSAIGDIDNDGMPDLVTIGYRFPTGEPIAQILKGTIHGFEHTGIGIPLTPGLRQVELSDIDGDGNLDIIVLNWQSLAVHFGNGDGTFVDQINHEIQHTERMALGDLNSNGYPDIAVALRSSNRVRVILNNGDRTFVSDTPYIFGYEPRSVAVADMNGNGFLDLLVGGSAPGVTVVLNDGTGGLRNPYLYPYGDPYSVALGDLNASGHLDMVFTWPHTNAIGVAMGHGDGDFFEPSMHAVLPNPRVVLIDDFDQNGIPDIAIACDWGTSGVVLWGDGNGGFPGAPTIYPVGSPARYAAAGDMIGNGFPDIVSVSWADRTLIITHNLGNGTFVQGPIYETTSSPTGVVLADFNSNGKLDVALTQPGISQVHVYLNTGGGELDGPIQLNAGGSPQSLAAGDLNNNGLVDLVVANYSHAGYPHANVRLLLNNGDQTFTEGVRYRAGRGVRDVAVADVTGNGHLDILAANSTSNSFSLLRGYGNGAFMKALNFPMVGAARIAVGDLNGDGRLDVATTSWSGITIATNQACSVGDLNGDGVVDVFDLFHLLREWGVCPPSEPEGDDCPADLNGDGVVNVADLLILFDNWG